MRIPRGDLEPALSVTPTDAGTPVDLSGANAARVHLMREDLSIIDRAGTIVDGAVELLWQAGDTDTVGVMDVEVEVDWGDGRTQTFPGDEQVHVVPSLA